MDDDSAVPGASGPPAPEDRVERTEVLVPGPAEALAGLVGVEARTSPAASRCPCCGTGCT